MSVKIDIDSGGVRLMKSNDLRWVCTSHRSGYTQNKDEYLLSELNYINFNLDFTYNQKFNINDSILNQIATIHDIDSIILYNSSGVEINDLTGDASLVRSVVTTEYGTVNYYNHTINTAALLGVYYVIITIGVDSGTDRTYRSELFEIKSMNADDGVYIEYSNNTASKYSDGIYYNGSMTFKFWIEGRIYDMELGEEKTMFNNFNYQPEVLKGQPIRGDILRYGKVPWFISEKLNLALQHDNLTINGIEYRSEEAVNDKMIQGDITGTLIREGSVVVRPQKYESYVPIIAETEAVTDDILYGESSTDEYLLWGDSDTDDKLVYDD